MKTINVTQGSELWHQARLQHFTASEAPQMMGASKYSSREDLLKLKATGIAPEINAATQRLFDKGHATEAAIRLFFESVLGEDLYPVTGSIEIEGLKLLASFDGLTMDERIGFEHKLWNEKLADACRAGELEPHYYWQLEQQLLISGAERIVFATSDGTDQKCVWMDYFPVAGRREALIAGWKQFAIDLANYVAPEAEAPKAIAEPVATLPAISFKTEFMGNKLVLTSNLNAYKAAASKLVEQSKEVLKTDQDFANAEARIKSCKDAEERIAHIQKQVLGEVADIDQFTRDLGAISEMLRQCRLNEDKQVKARKEQIRLEIINDVKAKFQEHVNTINAEIAQANVSFPTVRLPAINVDFLSAIKGKKTVKSLIESANDELARGKIEANRIAGIIDANLEMLNMVAISYDGLFADIQQLVVMDKEALNAIAQQRINAHKENEQRKIQAEAKRIADEQIERDRQAEAQRVAGLAKQNEAVAPAVQAPVVQDEIVMRTSAITQRPASTHAVYREQPAATAEQAPYYDEPEAMVDLSDYQKGRRDGIVAGLDLALAIFIKHGAKDFAKVLEDFIEVGVPAEAMKAA